MTLVTHKALPFDDMMADRLRIASTISAWAVMLSTGAHMGNGDLVMGLISDLFDANEEVDEADTWEGVSMTLAEELRSTVSPHQVTFSCNAYIMPDNGLYAPWEWGSENGGHITPPLMRVALLGLYEQSIRTMDSLNSCSILLAGMRGLHGVGTSQDSIPELVESPHNVASDLYRAAVDFVAEQITGG